MGILNVTADSFFDGGLYNSPEKALNHAKQMLVDGADVVEFAAQLFMKLLQSVFQSVVDVCLNGSIAGSCTEKFAFFQIYCGDLGVGTAEVNHQNRFHRIHQPLLQIEVFLQASDSFFWCSTRTEYSVVAHLLESNFYFVERLLTYYDVSSYIKKDGV